VYRPLGGWPKLALQIAVATVVMVLGIEFVVPATDQWLSADLSVKAAWLLSLSLGGAMLYGIVILLLGVRPAQLRNVEQ
jgi:peptidoglycan biosynthesis protein MviN/MurJ (putative lipid II flippase)